MRVNTIQNATINNPYKTVSFGNRQGFEFPQPAPVPTAFGDSFEKQNSNKANTSFMGRVLNSIKDFSNEPKNAPVYIPAAYLL